MYERIRYARTPDGIAIAYWAIGSGQPLIIMPSLVSHIVSEWQSHRGKLYQRLARNFTVIRYDGRGTGLSSREPDEVSLDAFVQDLEAVVQDLKLERFAVLATTTAAAAATAYAAANSDRVSHVIYWLGLTCLADAFSTTASALPLAETDWDLFVLTSAHLRIGWENGTVARNVALVYKDAISPEFHRRFREAAKTIDATDQLPSIVAPTLVLCRSNPTSTESLSSQRIAERVPGAQLIVLPGTSDALFSDDDDSAVLEVEGFLGAAQWLDDDLPGFLKGDSASLTDREHQVLELVSLGQSNKQIAVALGLRVSTVSTYMATIYSKIGVHSRSQATRYAMSRGAKGRPEF